MVQLIFSNELYITTTRVDDKCTKFFLDIQYNFVIKTLGSGALSGKMLLVRIIENNKIDAYFRSG